MGGWSHLVLLYNGMMLEFPLTLTGTNGTGTMIPIGKVLVFGLVRNPLRPLGRK